MTNSPEFPQEHTEFSALTLNELNSKVTEAIIAAEMFDDSNVDFAERATAWTEVSRIEELIADRADDATERVLAQRGAVMAAQKSGDTDRMTMLFERYGAAIWIS
jgi:hypothetical protein